MVYFGIKQSFFKLFSIVNFVYTKYTINVYNSKKILGLNSAKKNEVLGPVLGKISFVGTKMSL